MNPRRRLASLWAAACLAALAASPTQAAQPNPVAPAAPDPAEVEFLLATAAKDFRASGSPRPAAIRDARVGYQLEDGKGQYLLCGSYRPAGAQGAAWIPFATIKTSDYEHWLGGVAGAMCTRPTIRWYAPDHARALLERLGR